MQEKLSQYQELCSLSFQSCILSRHLRHSQTKRWQQDIRFHKRCALSWYADVSGSNTICESVPGRGGSSRVLPDISRQSEALSSGGQPQRQMEAASDR